MTSAIRSTKSNKTALRSETTKRVTATLEPPTDKFEIEATLYFFGHHEPFVYWISESLDIRAIADTGLVRRVVLNFPDEDGR